MSILFYWMNIIFTGYDDKIDKDFITLIKLRYRIKFVVIEELKCYFFGRTNYFIILKVLTINHF
jgi:hypothetical protein